MKAALNHISFHVSDFKKSLSFYNELSKYFGWGKIYEDKWVCGWKCQTAEIWIVRTLKKYSKAGFHRKRVGLNHIAFRVPTEKAVDIFHKTFLKKQRISVLYGGPKEYPQYGKGYYAVYFEDPDRIKLEVVYIPK
ncbi:MAG: VOC family protein [Candidatus Colwellbacteria bacterium]|nr:VOC family protein [Candidatus Colwellbacteria bacterium]